MNDNGLLRPRWGTFSVIDHKNLRSLVPEILLYDRLVFPVPTDVADRKRWRNPPNNWDPELLDQRIRELDDLAIPIPWTRELREEWSVRWARLKSLGWDTKALAMGQTGSVLAMKAWQYRIPPPIMIAAYQDEASARADFGLVEVRDTRTEDRENLHRQVGLLFKHRLHMPIIQDPEQAYRKAIELAHNPDYQRARRSLFEWEDQIVVHGWNDKAAIQDLEWRVEAHDDFIKATFGMTRRRRVFRAVQILASIAAGATAETLLSAQLGPATKAVGLAAEYATGWVFRLVEARFPNLAATSGDELDTPSAALHLAISAMYHDKP